MAAKDNCQPNSAIKFGVINSITAAVPDKTLMLSGFLDNNCPSNKTEPIAPARTTEGSAPLKITKSAVKTNTKTLACCFHKPKDSKTQNNTWTNTITLKPETARRWETPVLLKFSVKPAGKPLSSPHNMPVAKVA